MPAARTAVIVVDNGSSAVVPDGVELMRTGTNGGFGDAANFGFRHALAMGATACALLNDDVDGHARAGWTPCAPSWVDRVGAVQPKLLLPDGRVNSLGVAVDRYGQGEDIGIGEPDDPDDVQVRDIELFTGGAVLLSAAFIEDVGGFDERYFMYYEDVDLALRGAELGWRYRCAPASASCTRAVSRRRRSAAAGRCWRSATGCGPCGASPIARRSPPGLARRAPRLCTPRECATPRV